MHFIWFLDSLTLALSWLTSCFNYVSVMSFEIFDPYPSYVSITCFRLKGCILDSTILSLSNKCLSLRRH